MDQLLWTSGTIYINPEYDFLYMQQDKMAIVDFLCDLKIKHDPRGVGMRNLALCRILLGGSQYEGLDAIRPSEIESSKMRSFKEIICRLNQVWLVSIQGSARQMIPSGDKWEPIQKPFFDRSFPINARPHSFDLIGPDPRTIENDLSHLHLRSPKCLYDSWLRILERLEVGPREERYRLLLTFEPRQTVCNLGDAEDCLLWEDSGWTRKPGSMWPSQEPPIERVAASETPEFRDEDLRKAVRPAFGFWLFPANAFCDENQTGEPQGPIVTFDVRKHRPELALLRLNDGDTDRNVSKEVAAHHNIALEPPRLLNLRNRPHPGRITLPSNRF
ncbi:hypothetical protein FANTH_3987 [Fusarium anthophilum]|uniref:Uncharacterized protein n=1 Tax=Fusarium anthophilum TaxID=48485 RepID=A0A8H4ZQI3_9HYPO|nr:hypothetical protein FANTH_3987 [Fusarium anthophilum]